MIIVGLQDCPTCKVVKNKLSDLPYVELQREKNGSTSQIQQIKKALAKLNPTGNFPVILNDELTKIVCTDSLLNNLQKQMLQSKLEN